jgi:crotonobetainyl-CoA:carnitine CoA-transferase CaiB-like acyl-CoA transferase
MSVLIANQHKRSIALDLTTPAAQEVFRTLLARADVLIENFRRGRLSRMNIDPHELRPHDPRLVHCSVSAFGHSVSKQDTPAFDPVLQALSGLALTVPDCPGSARRWASQRTPDWRRV